MKARDLDLNLLLVFDALYQERSASRAAKWLNLSQPTISASLNKLRVIFNDQLFIKTLEGMEPTPRATTLHEPIAGVLQTIKQEILIGAPFDPATTEREFKIALGEIGEMVCLPGLLKELKVQALRARLMVFPTDPSRIADLLEEGKVEIAIGYLPALTGLSLVRQTLFLHPLTCLVSADLPLPNAPLTAEAFARMKHAVLGTESGYYEMFRQAFKDAGLELNIVLTAPRLVSLPHILPGSEFVAIVSQMVASLYRDDPRFREIELPLPVPAVAVKQFWHRRCRTIPPRSGFGN